MAVHKLLFQGWLFDGRSAVKHQAEVSLVPLGIEIKVEDGSTYKWPFEELRWNYASDRKNPPYHIDHSEDEHQIATLIVEDSDFIENVRRMAPEALDSAMDRNPKLKWGLISIGLLAMPLFIYSLWAYVIPAVSDKVAMEVPASWEEKLGEKVFNVFFSDDLKDLSDEQIMVLDKIEERLLLAYPDQPYTMTIHVDKRDMINALALPGGHIVVFQGLINQTERSEELAGVIAHEFQHVLKRHSTKSILRALSSQIFMTLMVGDVNGVMEGAIGIAEELNGLHMSRGMETEADREGMKMVLSAGMDPQGMVTMFEKLALEEKKVGEQINKALGREPEVQKEKTEDENSWLDYFSTHPQGKDRIKLLQEIAKANSNKSFTPLLPQVDWGKLMHSVEEEK